MSESTQVEIGSLADCRDVFIHGKIIIEGYSQSDNAVRHWHERSSDVNTVDGRERTKSLPRAKKDCFRFISIEGKSISTESIMELR